MHTKIVSNDKDYYSGLGWLICSVSMYHNAQGKLGRAFHSLDHAFSCMQTKLQSYLN